MYGLKMKREYLIDIIKGKKNCDARLQDTSIRGIIGLIDSDTYELIAKVDLLGTKRVNFEEYINWHISQSFDEIKAREYINSLDFTRLNSDAYFYMFGELEELDSAYIVKPKNETKTWVEFDISDSIKGFKQMSLF